MPGLVCFWQIPARASCALSPKPPVDAQLFGDIFLPDLWDFSIVSLIRREGAGEVNASFRLRGAGIWVLSFPDSQALGEALCHSIRGEEPQHCGLSASPAAPWGCSCPRKAMLALPAGGQGCSVASRAPQPAHTHAHTDTRMHTRALLPLVKPITWLLSQTMFNYALELITTGSSRGQELSKTLERDRPFEQTIRVSRVVIIHADKNFGKDVQLFASGSKPSRRDQ